MTGRHSIARALGVVLVAAALSGCISVFPKQPPAQLYRFGAAAPPAERPAAGGFSVQSLPTGFDRPAASDAILTMTGNEAAYIKGSRWVGPASTLFEAAVAHAFDAHTGPARLIARGEVAKADYLLKLDVRRFEADYDHGRLAPPTVTVEVYAALAPAAGRDEATQHIFTASVPAEENRAGAIARAFDAATRKALGDLIAWVDNKGAG